MEIELRFQRKARVWFDDRPAWLAAPPVHLKTCRSGGMVPSRASAAVELLVPRGADVQYGLLGGTFSATSGTQLAVLANVGGTQSESGLGYSDALVGRLETPSVGLPDYLAEAAMVGMQKRNFARDALTPGVLTLDCAAFGEISSSPDHFANLASILIALLVMRDVSRNSIEAELESLVNCE